MTDQLRLGPLPQTDVVRMTVTLPATVKADLDLYAELYGAAHKQNVSAAALVPHMLAAFMERDRAFHKARQAASRPAAVSDATISGSASTKATAADDSSPK